MRELEEQLRVVNLEKQKLQDELWEKKKDAQHDNTMKEKNTDKDASRDSLDCCSDEDEAAEGNYSYFSRFHILWMTAKVDTCEHDHRLPRL